MLLHDLVETSGVVAATRSRKAKVAALAERLAQADVAEVRRDHRQLVDVRLRQPLGDRGDLGLARAGGCDDAGGLDQVVQQHAVILPECADGPGWERVTDRWWGDTPYRHGVSLRQGMVTRPDAAYSPIRVRTS